MKSDNIIIQGARQHNLKNIRLKIPRHKLTVITGLSGSGKSSLAFDTLFAEGQRRYVESLSTYARQFLGRMEKPDVDFIDGLSPPSPSNRKQPDTIPVPRSARLRKFTTIFVFCLPASERRIVTGADALSPPSHWTRLSIKPSRWEVMPAFSSWRQWFQTAPAPM